MASVTQRIKAVKQPRGGYVPVKEFNKIKLECIHQLNEMENIHSSLIGLAVDYMTRFMNGASTDEAFKISLKGAEIINKRRVADKLLKEIKGLDKKSIINACKLVGYDVCFRMGTIGYRPVEDINPDNDTVKNIKIMIERSLRFIELYGPITLDGFTLVGGYTDIISTGDGDFLTETTLWDFKVSKSVPTSKHTLQLLIYYLMGKRSVNRIYFERLCSLGIFNPRLNTVYTLEINEISEETISEVSKYVIGYTKEFDKKNINKKTNREEKREMNKKEKKVKKKTNSKIFIAGGIVAILGVATLGIISYSNQKKTNEQLKNEIAEIRKEQVIEKEKNTKKSIFKEETKERSKKNTAVVKNNNQIGIGEKNKELEAEYIVADKELNELWGYIVGYGADYPDLIKKQKEWIKYKDSKDLKTKVRLTKERIETLNNWFSYQRKIQRENGYQFAQENECPSLDW